MEFQAKLNYYRRAPRKVRLVAGLIRGKKAEDALHQLRFVIKGASPIIIKLLQSALANAKNKLKEDFDRTSLYVKEIRVNEGPSLKRFMPVWRGMAHPYKKRTSHVSVIISDKK